MYHAICPVAIVMMGNAKLAISGMRDAVAWQLNTRPRKSLGWKCPAELFMPESFDFFQHHHQLVALRT